VVERSRPFATPADFPLHDGTPFRGLRVRRWGLGFVHRSRAILCRPAPNLNERYDRNFVQRCKASLPHAPLIAEHWSDVSLGIARPPPPSAAAVDDVAASCGRYSSIGATSESLSWVAGCASPGCSACSLASIHSTSTLYCRICGTRHGCSLSRGQAGAGPEPAHHPGVEVE
jgi:hypothetical protein